jgi:pyruvate dehydrogenase E2 component (dihydrolipoamide acetyltransferase)
VSLFTFPLPDVGEGLTEAEIVSWRVKPGDTVSVNQIVCEIETAKSLVELPSPFEGVVHELLAAEGDTVQVGAPIISVEGEGGPAMPAPDGVVDAVADAEGSVSHESPESSPKNLVGYGTGPSNPVSRRRRGAQAAETPTASPAARPDLPVVEAVPIIAKPPIRKLAKDLGVDLSSVVATGLAGEIMREDVTRHAGQAAVFRNLETPKWPENREDRIPVKGVRKAIAQAMVKSMFEAPHVFVNLGVAAATPRGLIVPNVKEAHTLSLRDLALALEKLTLTARDGKTTPEDMSSGTITITNLGSFGVDTGTPILNPGEVTIVALGTIKPKPWVVDGEVRARMVTTVAASFDHRVVDGDVASKFVADVASVMEEPALLLD